MAFLGMAFLALAAVHPQQRRLPILRGSAQSGAYLHAGDCGSLNALAGLLARSTEAYKNTLEVCVTCSGVVLAIEFSKGSSAYLFH